MLLERNTLLERNIIEGPYLQDILQQPKALRRTLAGFAERAELRAVAHALASGKYKRVVLTGMGSSLHALYPLHLTLSNRGFPSLLVETSELIHYLTSILNEDTLVVAVSQSGQSIEVLRLLEMAEGRSLVIGVTNNSDSALARKAQIHLPILAGSESSVSCKTYVASLLALEWLGAILIGTENLVSIRSDLSLAAPAVEAYLSDWRQHVEDLCDLVDGVKQIFVTGRGPSIATALTGGLILKESTRFAAEGMSCAAFRHGPFETLGPHVMVVIMAGDSRSRSLNQRLVALIDTDSRQVAFRIPELPDPLRPIVEMLTVQMISLALAACSGREAGRFELASKITSVE